MAFMCSVRFLSSFLKTRSDPPRFSEGAGVLDCRSAAIFEVNLVQNAFVRLLRAEKARDFPALIHFAAVNLQNTVLAQEVRLKAPTKCSSDC